MDLVVEDNAICSNLEIPFSKDVSCSKVKNEEAICRQLTGSVGSFHSDEIKLSFASSFVFLIWQTYLEPHKLALFLSSFLIFLEFIKCLPTPKKVPFFLFIYGQDWLLTLILSLEHCTSVLSLLDSLIS